MDRNQAFWGGTGGGFVGMGGVGVVREKENHYESSAISCNLVAQCSATPATVAATPPCSATPFQTQISVRHLLAHRGGGVRHQNFLGV